MSLFAARTTPGGSTTTMPVGVRTTTAPRDDVGPVIRPPVMTAQPAPRLPAPAARVPSNGGGGNTTATVSFNTPPVPSVQPPSDQQALVSTPPPGPDDLLPFPADAPTATPFYKKWWFWVLIAGGTGTGVYIYKKRRG